MFQFVKIVPEQKLDTSMIWEIKVFFFINHSDANSRMEKKKSGTSDLRVTGTCWMGNEKVKWFGRPVSAGSIVSSSLPRFHQRSYYFSWFLSPLL